ncbi:hypothetical protein L210DRAFT_2875640 [Boletus edulis BED1]|uniref:Uncharacterized protein n=1 Tax=Boletus edulis BED1 TaxID=1328754 RepID=A0AAD4BJ26_BOLED|nr:hypothetical protein L210DRAFT_2875640 [Boletus edulis BED1]
MIPLYEDDVYPPLTCLDLATNTRFRFAHAWREHASKLREAELEWTFGFRILGKACILARTVNTSSPRMPGTAGYVSSEQLRPWQFVPPESPPQGKSTKHVSDEQTHLTDGHAILEVEANDLSLPEDPLPGPSVAIDPSLSNSTVSEGLTAVDAEHDMHQYFNGLGDSPAKHVPPCQQLASMHAFRPQLFPSAGHTQMNSLGLGFPSLELDPRLADTGDRECFLGVPPSPPPADMESSTIPGPISDPSFEPVCSPASPSNIFDASPTDAWSFEQGEGLLLGSETPPSNHITPTALGTIDPSLLGPEQGQQPPQAPENTTHKRRSKLPEPIIYIRRPIDSASMPLLSGKRSVQIKYRDSGESQALSNLADPIEQPGNDADDSSRAKKRSAPSRKLRECHSVSEAGSDYIPEASTSKIKLKVKRPSLRGEEVVEHQGSVPSMSFCHQCRNSTVRPKMSCSNVNQGRVCGKRFCNRCILYRLVHLYLIVFPY